MTKLQFSVKAFSQKNTYLAWSHSLKTIISMLKYLLDNLKFDIFILGKCQTDNFESRWGQYTQKCRGNTWELIQKLKESERKLKVKRLLKLHSSTITASVTKYLTECADESLATISEVEKNYFKIFLAVNLTLMKLSCQYCCMQRKNSQQNCNALL